MNDDARRHRTTTEVIADIEALAQEDGYIYALSFVIFRDLYLDPSEAADINWRDHLSFQELSFLCGLMVKKSITMTYVPSPEAIEKLAMKTCELFEELHMTYSSPAFGRLIANIEKHKDGRPTEEDYQEGLMDIFGKGDAMIESIFYSESGAYDFQYFDLVPRRFAKDDEWLQVNRGFSSTQMSQFAYFLKSLSEQKHNSMTKPTSFEHLCDLFLKSQCFTPEELLGTFDNDTVVNLLSAFSVTPGTVNPALETPGQYNAIDSHPLIKLPGGNYFLPISFLLAQSTYESPFYWMQRDVDYKDKASENRGATTEEIAFDFLEKVFGNENVFRQVRVAGKKGEDKTDIDVLVFLGNKALILQAKSKKLTTLSRSGNQAELIKDFDKAVQEAYDQAKISRDALLGGGKLTDKNGNNVKPSVNIEEAYIVCMTSDHYPAVTHQTEIYLKRDKSEPPPVSISIFDLEIMCFYLPDPYDFLYYIRQRVALNEFCRGMSEISLLAFHLNQKLFRSPDSKTSLLAIDPTWAQLVDANFPAMKGRAPVTEATDRLHHKWKNDDFQKIVSDLKKSNPHFTDAVFLLYDLAGNGADELIENIKLLRQKARADGQPHDAALIYDGGSFGITLYCSSSETDDLGKRLFMLSQARKYKTKTNAWLGIGISPDSDRFIDIGVFSSHRWEEDEELENLSKIVLKQGTIMGGRRQKIGRNESCPCGSGRKYKKCCLK